MYTPRLKGSITTIARLDELNDEARERVESSLITRQERAAALRKIKGDAHRTAGLAQPSEGEAYGGRMQRKDEAPKKQPAKVQPPLLEVIDAGAPGGIGRDTGVTDGTTDDEHRADLGEFVRQPEPLPARY